jgi:hypothetical protein
VAAGVDFSMAAVVVQAVLLINQVDLSHQMQL